MRRRIAPVALAAAITVLLSACGSGGLPGSPAESSNVTTITWWDTSDTVNEAPTFRALVADFERTNLEIKVDHVSVPFTEARARFQAAAGKDAPDVLRAAVDWTAGLAKAGLLAPLDGTEAATDAEKLQPQLIEQARYDGKLYGMPQTTDILALVYNKGLFAKAGISKPPATWNELKADAAQIKEETGADGFAFHPQGYYAMPFLYGEDVDLVDFANKKITVSSPAAVKGIDALKSLVTAPGVARLDTTDDGYTNVMQAFKNGKVASIIQGPWENANIFRGAAFADNGNLGIATVPGGSSGKAGAPLGGHNLVASARSDAAHRAAALKFIAFMTSSNAQTYTAVKNSTLPTRTDAFTSLVSVNLGILGYQKVLDSGRPRPALAEYSALYDPFGADLLKILSGQESTRAGLDHVGAEAKRLLPDFADR
ncbi:extracellular solute-binding protein [Kitasatospora atroaurantiaca]|uniref:Carbohydrate ABC transporter substrate-binding protein (CUT1 family) n=1 Tax=Kitasatospora atroaurantiaca TaxID=285545 RepID=A0A561EIZ7_9ACTN|nr:extracellular solute-binding protein [Kitasatospora atroaurantiaca]TWE15589.1 carbohydrate ABC transporter substrate-binding protein (CUT1 family) [Kitasatospora atroaurantiaca]